ncbi:MAG: D-Ala-D-Ala carboxypeptidase family metallohydrolase [Candidatus Methanoperedens sp.]|nr:D-Ala-D-Ala carboxypeptidase family metallohydrolase [Candidatus Methanoperedens sp.]
MGDLTNNFSRNEFACKCCGKDDINKDFVDLLQSLRNTLSRSMKIVSGVRCEKHNKEVGGVPGSAHTKGLASDIECTDGEYRFYLLQAIFTTRLFQRVEIKDSWIHIDVDLTKPHPSVFFK